MSNETQISHPIFSLLPTEVEGFESLAELALDMRWSWNHCADELWRSLDAVLWQLTQNPLVVLQTVSRDQLQRCLAEPAFRKKVDDLLQSKHQAAQAQAWFHQAHPQAPLSLRRLLQPRIHVERGPSHLLGRPGQCRRRPTQSRQRPGRPGGRRRTALPAGLFPPGD